jgi:uncharacterized protein YcnI
MSAKSMLRATAVVAVLATIIGTAYAHVTVQPKQSAPGATEKYAMRVPTEKFVPTVSIEVEFPAALDVMSFESKAGWKMEAKKSSSDRLVGVVLTGVIPTGESTIFNFTARNPNTEGKLAWKVIQIYQDGTKSEWTGAEGSRSPSPVVEIKKAPVDSAK